MTTCTKRSDIQIPFKMINDRFNDVQAKSCCAGDFTSCPQLKPGSQTSWITSYINTNGLPSSYYYDELKDNTYTLADKTIDGVDKWDTLAYTATVSGGRKINIPAGNGERINCIKVKPHEDDKWDCCTNPNATSTKCGRDSWCVDGPDCITWMKAKCSDSVEFGKNLPACMKYCATQNASDGDGKAGCQLSASKYCAIPDNKNKAVCKCINYSTSTEYTKLKAKLPNGGVGLPNPQCWSNPCVANGEWTTYLKSYDSCPANLALCIQSLSVKDVEAADIGKIGSTCNINQNTGSGPTSTDTPSTLKNIVTSPSSSPSSSPATSTETSTNLLLYVGIGIFLLFFFFIMFKGRSTSQGPMFYPPQRYPSRY
jgi:hypothetical protein